MRTSCRGTSYPNEVDSNPDRLAAILKASFHLERSDSVLSLKRSSSSQLPLWCLSAQVHPSTIEKKHSFLRKFGWCGTTPDYCSTDCQSQCGGGGGGGGGGDIKDLVSKDSFDKILKHRNDGGCPAKGDGRLHQMDHIYAWGYCFNKEKNPGSYCATDPNYPCAAGKQYYGRGPIQLSWNYNYGLCGKAIGANLLNNPDLVATDPVISFKTAFWLWMTPQSPKPSCHDVITGRWNPSGADKSAGRYSGYGTITSIINGGLECGKGSDGRVADRIGFFKRYCDFLGVGYGDNLDCYNQKPFGSGLATYYSPSSSKESSI
ncbi:hypothetical protein ACLB2K_066918 [Fragaria x ananassa]